MCRAAGCLLQRLLCVGEAAAVAAGRDGCRADRGDPRGAREPRTAPTVRRAFMPSSRPRAFASAASASRDLMTQAGLAGVSRRKFVTTTVRDGGRQAPDLVERNFTAEAPDLLWVADITYIPTWAGFLYLAVVLDAFSRRIVGWSMATTLATQLVLDALNMALATRRPKDVIHHSDQGSQYTSIEFGKRCREAGVRPSMGSVGDAYDNAMCESFFATLECELLDRRRFKTQAEARMAVVRVHRGLLQSAPPPLLARLSLTDRLRAPASRSRRSIPTHTSLPPCSRPSRTSPPGGRKMRPSLTAPARDGRTIVRAGTEEWLRRGPNQRMARNRRTTCRQIRYPDPKLSPLHETGASPKGPLAWTSATANRQGASRDLINRARHRPDGRCGASAAGRGEHLPGALQQLRGEQSGHPGVVPSSGRRLCD